MSFTLSRVLPWIVAGAGMFALVFAAQTAGGTGVASGIVLPSLAAALVFGVGLLLYAVAGRGRARVHRLLDHRIAHKAVTAIARKPETLKLSGEARQMTYLVCGIRGFCEASDGFLSDPQAFVRWNDRLMTPLAQAVLENGGTLCGTASGRLTAIFNAPLDDPDHAAHACACALRMVEEWTKAEHGANLSMDIGVHTGIGLAGNFGTRARPEYAAAGESVRKAAEFESLCGKYGVAVVVSETTRDAAARNFAFLEIDRIPASAGPLPIFAVLGNVAMRAHPKFRALQTFHRHLFEAYRVRDWERARSLIAQARALSGASQMLYDLYLERIGVYQMGPIGDEWAGPKRAAQS